MQKLQIRTVILKNQLNRPHFFVITVKPLETAITSKKTTLRAGKKTSVRCESKGSRPPAIMTWWRNNEKLQQQQEHTVSTVSDDVNMTQTSVLTFVPSSSDHGKYLKCRADNPHIASARGAKEDGWQLNVLCKYLCQNIC